MPGTRLRYALVLAAASLAMVPPAPVGSLSFVSAAHAEGKGKKAKKARKAKRSRGADPVVEAALGAGLALLLSGERRVEVPRSSTVLAQNSVADGGIDAVLLHIRTGAPAGGAVGLLAGLAAADARARRDAEILTALEDRMAAHQALQQELATIGFASVADYLAMRDSGVVDPTTAQGLDALIERTGGLTADGRALAYPPPDQATLAAAQAALQASRNEVVLMETAYVDGLYRDGDPARLLAEARARLAPYQADILAAVEAAEPQMAAADPVAPPQDHGDLLTLEDNPLLVPGDADPYSGARPPAQVPEGMVATPYGYRPPIVLEPPVTN